MRSGAGSITNKVVVIVAIVGVLGLFAHITVTYRPDVVPRFRQAVSNVKDFCYSNGPVLNLLSVVLASFAIIAAFVFAWRSNKKTNSIIARTKDLFTQVSDLIERTNKQSRDINGIINKLADLSKRIDTQSKDILQITKKLEMVKKHFDETRKKVEETHDVVSKTVGLPGYVELAAKIYERPGLERVVTSLQHWLPANVIRDGIKECNAKKLVFIGRIDWDQYLPGVLWRFVQLRKKAKQNTMEKKNPGQKLQIIHVNPDVLLPLFVVSKSAKKQNESNKSDQEETAGELLIGNPRGAGTIAHYGILLGKEKESHGQVLFYNVLCDQILDSKIQDLPNYDGLKYLLIPEVDGIKKGNLHKFTDMLKHPAYPGGDPWDTACERLVDQLHKLVAKQARPDEKGLLLSGKLKVKRVVKDFMNVLKKEGIVKEGPIDNGKRKLIINSDKANCENFLNFASKQIIEGGDRG